VPTFELRAKAYLKMMWFYFLIAKFINSIDYNSGEKMSEPDAKTEEEVFDCLKGSFRPEDR
jgi:hypothetical protein